MNAIEVRSTNIWPQTGGPAPRARFAYSCVAEQVILSTDRRSRTDRRRTLGVQVASLSNLSLRWYNPSHLCDYGMPKVKFLGHNSEQLTTTVMEADAARSYAESYTKKFDET